MDKSFAYKIALDALESKRTNSLSELRRSAGTIEKSTLPGPNGETYFLDVAVDELRRKDGVRITATVDLGNSFKLERVQEHIDIVEE